MEPSREREEAGTMLGNVQARTRMGAMDALARGIPAELTTFVKKTYGMLAFSVLLGAGACYAMLQAMPTQTIVTGPGKAITIPAFPQWALWLLWGGTFVFSMIGSRAKSGARSGEASPLGLVALVGMVLCSGAMLAPTIGIYLGLGWASTVAAAAVVTAVTFTGLTALVFLTGKNFTFMGKFLFVVGLAFMAAWMVNLIFVHSAGFQWWMAAVGAILFCAYILFDTSSVVHFYGPENLVVPAVIALYLDIFNLFVMLLVLLGGRRSD
jgi:modulator of FtsH protease